MSQPWQDERKGYFFYFHPKEPWGKVQKSADYLNKPFGFTSFNRTDNNELPLAMAMAAVMSSLKGAVMSANNT